MSEAHSESITAITAKYRHSEFFSLGLSKTLMLIRETRKARSLAQKVIVGKRLWFSAVTALTLELVISLELNMILMKESNIAASVAIHFEILKQFNVIFAVIFLDKLSKSKKKLHYQNF
jgi:hypothetical protein